MATTTYTANGTNGSASTPWLRFGDVPSSIDIPVLGGVEEEAVEVDLIELNDDPTELFIFLEDEKVAKKYWMTISLAYAKQQEIDQAIGVVQRGLEALRNSGQTGQSLLEERLGYMHALVWMYFCKCRDAPRIPPAGAGPEFKTKDFYLRLATSALNDLARLSPGYRHLHLARGVSLLLRAALQSPGKTGPGGQDNPERAATLRDALRAFEEALRVSGGRNIMALMGKARVQFATRQYGDALHVYQTILERAPHVTDPDPRIGIGCCFWQLGHKEDAKVAWDRALEVNPKSKSANILLGIYYLHYSSQFATSDSEFIESYGKAMTQYTQNAYRIDNKMPLASSTFGGYFLVRKLWKQLEMLARTSIEYTDVNAIASDGWYLLARKEHEAGDYAKAYEHYLKADAARGGDEKGHLPAKFGAAQIKILMNDPETAKFRLDKLMQQSKSVEAQTLLGMLYAESVFASKITATQSVEIQKQKDEINSQRKKAIGLLEQVRAAWKDPKKKTSVDPAILLNLARLYETESAEKSLQCLKQVERIEIEAIPEDMRPAGIEDKDELQQALRELLPAPLLNNMGCFLFQGDKLAEARDMFNTALKACEKISDTNSNVDTDAFITTVSYNLGRTYEAEGLLDNAQKVYEDLLVNHSEYSDALARLAFISYQKNPEEGIQEMKAMFEGESENLEIRGLYGWFLNRTKKRTIDFHHDEEQMLNKESLSMSRYDTYVLTSMGNICLAIAREMRGEQNKTKRQNTYSRALELYEKALQLDPQNAYAAQGVGIAVVEEKKDLNMAVQVFGSVRETMKDATVYMNLGHVYCELRQFGKAIENYEVALAKRDRVSEVAVLSSLGRVWFLKGRHEKSVPALQQSLDYSKRVQEMMPGQIHFRFNVALLQVYIADLMASDQPSKRTMSGLETAAAELEDAIASFQIIAQDEKPPYPKNVIEERANHGKTRMAKIKKAMEDQAKFDEHNEQRVQAALEQREAERQRRENARLELERLADEKRAKVLEERAAMLEKDKEFAQKRAEEDALRDSDDDKERRKRNRKSTGGAPRRKRRGDDIVSDGHLSSGEGGYTSPSDDDSDKSEDGDVDADESEGEKERRLAARDDRKREKLERKEARRAERAEKVKEKPRKKRKLQNAVQAKKSSKYKSDDRIVDSDEEAEMFAIDAADRGGSGLDSGAEGGSGAAASRNGRSLSRTPGADKDGDEVMRDDDDDSDVPVAAKKGGRVPKKRAVVDSDDE